MHILYFEFFFVVSESKKFYLEWKEESMKSLDVKIQSLNIQSKSSGETLNYDTIDVDIFFLTIKKTVKDIDFLSIRYSWSIKTDEMFSRLRRIIQNINGRLLIHIFPRKYEFSFYSQNRFIRIWANTSMNHLMQIHKFFYYSTIWLWKYIQFFFIQLPKLMKNKNMKEKHLWSFKILYIFWL